MTDEQTLPRARGAVHLKPSVAAAVRAWSGWLVLAAVSLVTAGGCVGGPFVWVGDLPLTADVQQVIGPRDTVLVLVRNQAALSGEFVVREDGAYLQPTLGNVQVAGKEPTAVAAELKVRFSGMVIDPDINVAILKRASVRVNVVGEVKTPGTYELTHDHGVISALAAAGWLNDFARRDGVFVVRTSPRAANRPPQPQERIRFRADDLTSAEPHAARFRLLDGDVVVVE
jgi:polysaccharide export outer membrane protein